MNKRSGTSRARKEDKLVDSPPYSAGSVVRDEYEDEVKAAVEARKFFSCVMMPGEACEVPAKPYDGY
jgi:hypothetical protein